MCLCSCFPKEPVPIATRLIILQHPSEVHNVGLLEQKIALIIITRIIINLSVSGLHCVKGEARLIVKICGGRQIDFKNIWGRGNDV